ncbi:MAG: hypothetical protein KDC48_00620 [Planctomycetes bacterium]|nr:hypothetical protein [Planctomycetota bacterium]
MQLRRADGSCESFELETRSCLLHDLVHFAVESEAGLRASFYGRLARGASYESLAAVDIAAADSGELAQVEQVVGPLQSGWRRGADPSAVFDRMRSYFAELGQTGPAWLDEGLVQRVWSRLRQLEGHWRATPFGEVMQLTFLS